jgi:hypothetical protein
MWQEVTLQFTVPEDALGLQLELGAAPESEIAFDQVTIAGAPDSDTQPDWVRNGSGEQVASVGERVAVAAAGLLGRPGLARRLFVSGRVNLSPLLRDREVRRFAFESFWGNFGAAAMVPIPPVASQVLAWACGAAAVGLGVSAWRTLSRRNENVPSWRKRALALLAGAIGLVIVQMVVSVMALYRRWGPQGRYLFPVVWPIGVLLAIGWLRWARPNLRRWLLIGVAIAAVALDLAALNVVGQYFYGL